MYKPIADTRIPVFLAYRDLHVLLPLSHLFIPEQIVNGNYPAAAIRFAMSPIVSGLMWIYLDVVL